MCGIVGFIQKWKSTGFSMKHQKLFNQMLYADALRGWDATGVIGVTKNGDFGIMKEASDAYVFSAQFDDSDLDKQVYREGVAIIGHNRAKTVGENKDENAHPFVVDNTFALVHNGTLRNHKSMHDTEVDSEALAKTFKEAMDQDDWKVALEEALGKINGAFAVVWYDQKRDEVCMIRNSERPLALVTISDGWVFASEGAMAQWVLIRNDIKIQECIMIKPHTLYKWDMKKTGGDFSETFLSPKFPTKTSSVVRGGYSNGTKTSPTTTVSSTVAGALPLSKNAFKRLRAKLLGKPLKFWLEDYVDTLNDNQGRCLTALVMGSSLDGAYDLVEVAHSVRSIVDLQALGIKESDFYGYVEMEGKVTHADYDAATKSITIHVNNCEVLNLCESAIQ